MDFDRDDTYFQGVFGAEQFGGEARPFVMFSGYKIDHAARAVPRGWDSFDPMAVALRRAAEKRTAEETIKNLADQKSEAARKEVEDATKKEAEGKAEAARKEAEEVAKKAAEEAAKKEDKAGSSPKGSLGSDEMDTSSDKTGTDSSKDDHNQQATVSATSTLMVK